MTQPEEKADKADEAAKGWKENRVQLQAKWDTQTRATCGLQALIVLHTAGWMRDGVANKRKKGVHSCTRGFDAPSLAIRLSLFFPCTLRSLLAKRRGVPSILQRSDDFDRVILASNGLSCSQTAVSTYVHALLLILGPFRLYLYIPIANSPV